MRAVLVSHTHWDREWYREFQAFRARLVEAVDRLLDLCAQDPGYRFLLDGQSIALEDYAEIRPARAAELREHVRAGRIAIGPWYVQPDSILPSGEAHVRNLLEGRRAGEAFGPVSRVAYTPDSFGHPAQFPQLFAGFGMSAFVYWRGHGDEALVLPPEWDWVAPDGSRILACHLGKGYFGAASNAKDPVDAIARVVAERARDLAEMTRSGAVLLMNGIDHAPPERRSAELAAAIAAETGLAVERGLLEDYVAAVRGSETKRPDWQGELIGARGAPLLPGVWSTRSWIKLENRRCETGLEGFAEPFAALASRFGGPDERPSLRLAWRSLLQNQAHDSLCGCSIDAVHEQMRPRFSTARGLAEATTSRALRFLSGAPDPATPWSDEWEVAVFNPSPTRQSDRVRLALDPDPWMAPSPDLADVLHPILLRDPASTSYTVDGAPARVIPAEAGRLSIVPDRGGLDLEFVARDVPALGWRRFQVKRAEEAIATVCDEVEAGTAEASIVLADRKVSVRTDGTLDLVLGDRSWGGIGALEDVGDRGDSYDFDSVGTNDARLVAVNVRRSRHPAGFVWLDVERTLSLPLRLTPDRKTRTSERTEITQHLWASLMPDVARLDLDVGIDNTAEDHRLRLLFPLGEKVDRFDAATTFDVKSRKPGARADDGWLQRAPATFPAHGFVHAAGLSVVAPGLSEAEVLTLDGSSTLALTLLRSVGYLSRPDLTSRPGPAGPAIATPGAQCLGPLRARFGLFAGLDPGNARAFELGLRAVPCGEAVVLREGVSALRIQGAVVLSALKPAEDGSGVIVRLQNPSDVPQRASLEVGFPFQAVVACSLDESADDGATLRVKRDGTLLSLDIPPHRLATLRFD